MVFPNELKLNRPLESSISDVNGDNNMLLSFILINILSNFSFKLIYSIILFSSAMFLGLLLILTLLFI